MVYPLRLGRMSRGSMEINRRATLQRPNPNGAAQTTNMLIYAISTAYVRVILRLYFIVVLAATAWLTKRVLHIKANISVG